VKTKEIFLYASNKNKKKSFKFTMSTEAQKSKQQPKKCQNNVRQNSNTILNGCDLGPQAPEEENTDALREW
jgi:hypothetical protein